MGSLCASLNQPRSGPRLLPQLFLIRSGTSCLVGIPFSYGNSTSADKMLAFVKAGRHTFNKEGNGCAV